MQFRHHHFGCGSFFFVFRMNVRRNAAAIVRYADRIIRMDDDGNFVAMPGQCLINCVINNLENHVVQAGAVAGVSDIHAGTFAYSFKSLENFDAFTVVFVSGARFFVAHCFSFLCCLLFA